jgi:two-component system sensor histidine kinase KdpD
VSADRDTPPAEELLRKAEPRVRGRLKIFLGAAPGVGKTYEMLTDGLARKKAGVDVVIGFVETHDRTEAQEIADSLQSIGLKQDEMDVDAILARHPQLALIDELAHSNSAGSRHLKRWQDVEELLAGGIDVYSTLNVQHIESLNDVVASFTNVRVNDTVPDRIVEDAEIEVVDIPPDELIERLKDGKVCPPKEAAESLDHFYSKSTLSALRELALRRAAQTVDMQMLEYVRSNALAGNWAAAERIVVAVSELPGSKTLIRAAKRLADAQDAPWTAVYVETPRSLSFNADQRQQVADNMQLGAQLGANVASVAGPNVVDALKSFLHDVRATQLVVGKSARSKWFELRHGSVVDRLVRETPGVAVHVLPHEALGDAASTPEQQPQVKRSALGSPTGYGVSLLLVAACTLVAVAVHAFGGLTNVALVYLIPVLASASRYGWPTGVFTGVVSALAYNFFFLPPQYTFTIQDPENLLTVMVFIAVAIVTSRLAARVRIQADLAERGSGQNAALASFARVLAGVATRQELGKVLCGEVSTQFDVDAVLTIPDGTGLGLIAAVPADISLGPIDTAAAEWAMERKVSAGRGSSTLAASEWFFQPLLASGQALAVLGVAKKDGSEPVRADQLPFLMSFVDQAALALERINLVEQMITSSYGQNI